MGLGIYGLSRVGEAIQEVVLRNHPQRLRNQLFPKLVQVLLEVDGIPDPVPVYL